MKLITILLAVLCLTTCSAVENATGCPQFHLSGPSQSNRNGAHLVYRLSIKESISKADYRVIWRIKNGVIVYGQRTSQIEVRKNQSKEALNVSVEVRGPANCTFEDSIADAGISLSEVTLIDEFADLSKEELRNKLEKVNRRIKDKPTFTAYLINYGTNEAISERSRQMNSWIEEIYEDSRMAPLVIVHGGEDASAESGIRTRIWLVPVGADTSGVK